MDRLSAQTAAAFAIVPETVTGTERARLAITTLAGLLERNAPVLSPFMLLANSDPVIAAAGKAAYDEMNLAFEDAMIGPTDASPQRRRAVRWSCTVVYSVLARQLALGSDPGAAADYALDGVVDELVVMTVAYMATVGN
jgi:hypothetical protein